MPRIRLYLSGVVQGVGLRPQVLRVARSLGLSGFVCNLGGRVEIQAQGDAPALERLVIRLRHLEPPARVEDIAREPIAEEAESGQFVIVESEANLALPALPADLAPCVECLAEVSAGTGRRSGYCFTACTRCGARYSIVKALPYDRGTTTLVDFPLCQACQTEYASPDDRRFHAQAMACPDCGPTLELLDAVGEPCARGDAALLQAAGELAAGRIIALKGVGGFQLLCDALDEAAVQRLRERKRREEKPLAVLFVDAIAAAEHASLDSAALALLTSPEAPIVLVPRKGAAARPVAAAVAPHCPELGCLLPASPLHYLLARAAARPLVCTSGNQSGEPLCVDNGEALERLRGIADVFLLHDREIARPLDDSVARLGPQGPLLIRRARGLAPRVVAALAPSDAVTPTVLALGADLKAAPALLLRGQLVLGQHVGDLSEARTVAAWRRNIDDLLSFFAAKPDVVSCDLHPDYVSTRYAQELAASWGVQLVPVQHHHAHLAAVMAERRLAGPVLGFAWDGTGLGSDGTIWGGEALVVAPRRVQRVARLEPFPLPGGDAAAREPWRSALGVLFSIDPALAARHGAEWCEPVELAMLLRALERGVNSPQTSSIGRLFDAVAALTGAPKRLGFEGQAAMALQFAAQQVAAAQPYDFELEWLSPSAAVAPRQHGTASLLKEVLRDVAGGSSRSVISARFHAALVAAAVQVAERTALADVVLAGGCFQNRLLLESLTAALEARGHRVHGPGQIPPNDGGIAAGQAAVAFEIASH